MRLGYALVRGSAQFLFHLGYGLSIHGMENIPRDGAVIIASNHRSNFDPPILGSTIRREVHFFAKEELFRKKITGSFLRYLNAFPVRRGQFDRSSLKYCLDILEQEGALVFFPEGTRAPADGFLKAKLGLGWVVCLSKAPVVPVYLHGTSALKPKLLGRPWYNILVGTPISSSDLIASGLRGHDLYQAVSDAILERIRELSLNTPHQKVISKGPIFDRDIIEEERLR